MDRSDKRRQIDQNYDAFQRLLSAILTTHRDQYVLLRDREIVEYFDTAGDAYRAGLRHFPDHRFSIQEVTDEPIDLGFQSHVRGD